METIVNTINYNLIYSILGIIGGILTAIGDILFDLKGSDNEEIGDLKMINSNWSKMPTWKFTSSILLATVGVPLYILGGISLSNQILASDELLSNILQICIITGGIGGYFIHTLVCIIPVIYKHLIDKVEFEVINSLVNKIWDVVKIPFILLYVVLVLFTSIIVIISICKNYLNVPNWFVILNPLVFQIIGVILRIINPKLFYEIPSVVMGSLGISMYGVIGLVSFLGGGI